MKSPATLRCFGALGWLVLAGQLSCAKEETHKPVEPVPTELVAEAREKHALRLELASGLVDQNGCITPKDCDGKLWCAKYASARNTELLNMDAFEYPGQPGRYARRPIEYGYCYLDESEGGEPDQGSGSSCSRDMAMGDILWAQAHNNPGHLQRHYDFVKSNGNKCGTGDITATYYNPFFRNFIEAVLDTLSLVAPKWPTEQEYLAGLDDYKAHLQMLNIHIRQKAEGGLTDAMLRRVVEHSDREPQNPFYAYLRGKYTGDMNPAVKACVEGTYGTYVRCGVGLDTELCVLAELIFACDLVLEYFDDAEASLL